MPIFLLSLAFLLLHIVIGAVSLDNSPTVGSPPTHAPPPRTDTDTDDAKQPSSSGVDTLRHSQDSDPQSSFVCSDDDIPRLARASRAFSELQSWSGFASNFENIATYDHLIDGLIGLAVEDMLEIGRESHELEIASTILKEAIFELLVPRPLPPPTITTTTTTTTHSTHSISCPGAETLTHLEDLWAKAYLKFVLLRSSFGPWETYDSKLREEISWKYLLDSNPPKFEFVFYLVEVVKERIHSQEELITKIPMSRLCALAEKMEHLVALCPTDKDGRLLGVGYQLANILRESRLFKTLNEPLCRDDIQEEKD